MGFSSGSRRACAEATRDMRSWEAHSRCRSSQSMRAERTSSATSSGVRPERFRTRKEWSAPVHGVELGPVGEALDQAVEQVLPGEGVAGALHEQHGGRDVAGGGPRGASRGAPGDEADRRGRRARRPGRPPPRPGRRSARPSSGPPGPPARHRSRSRATSAASRARGLEHARASRGGASPARCTGSCTAARPGPIAARASARSTSIGVWRVPPAPWPRTTTVRPAPWSDALVSAEGSRSSRMRAKHNRSPPPGGPAAVIHSPLQRGGPLVRVLVRLRREALQPHAGPQVPLPLPEARGGLRPPRVRSPGARRLHPHHRRGGDRQDDPRPLLPLPARPEHPHRGGALPDPDRRRASRHHPRRPAHRGAGGLPEGPGRRPPPFPPRGPGRRPQRRAPDRRVAGPLDRGPRAGAADLQPGDRHREADPDRAHGPVGAAGPPGPARAAAARPAGDRPLPPLAPQSPPRPRSTSVTGSRSPTARAGSGSPRTRCALSTASPAASPD